MRGFVDRLAVKKRRPDPARQADVSAEVHELILNLRAAKGSGMSERFAAVLRNLAADGKQIEQGVVAWVQLVEILIQSAEQRYPNGKGGLKKGQVRAALYAIFHDQQLNLPALPRYLQPLVMEIVVDWSIDALVDNIETYALWDASKPYTWSPGGLLRDLLSRLMLLIAPVIEGLSWLYVKLRYSEPLTPEVAAAVQNVRTKALVLNKNALFASASHLAVFLSQHRPQVIAGVKAFFEVVAMAERLANAPGPEKKAYATAIVRAVLEELGFPIGQGIFGMIADAFISAGIESALALFQKRAPETFR
jgi:hypothetical protein